MLMLRDNLFYTLVSFLLDNAIIIAYNNLSVVGVPISISPYFKYLTLSTLLQAYISHVQIMTLKGINIIRCLFV